MVVPPVESCPRQVAYAVHGPHDIGAALFEDGGYAVEQGLVPGSGFHDGLILRGTIGGRFLFRVHGMGVRLEMRGGKISQMESKFQFALKNVLTMPLEIWLVIGMHLYTKLDLLLDSKCFQIIH